MCSRDTLYVGCMPPSIMAGHAVGMLVGVAGFWPGWLQVPVSWGDCRPTGGWGIFLSSWLCGQEECGTVAYCWYARPCSPEAGCIAQDMWDYCQPADGPGPYTAGYLQQLFMWCLLYSE